MIINDLFVPMDVWSHIFSYSRHLNFLPFTCKRLFEIFTDVGFNSYLDDPLLGERAWLIQQRFPSFGSAQEKIRALYQSTMEAICSRKGKKIKHIQQDINVSYQALLREARFKQNLPNEEDARPTKAHLAFSVEQLTCLLNDLNLLNFSCAIETTSDIEIPAIKAMQVASSLKEMSAQAQKIHEWFHFNGHVLTSLEKLDVFNQSFHSRSGWTGLPKEIGMLTNLRELVLTNNELISLPFEVFQLRGLERLDLSSNPLTSLPKEISRLTGLTRFTASHQTSLPSELFQLTNLRELFLSNNNLTSLPKEIGQLIRLRWAGFNKSHLTSLPQEIGQLTSLQSLNLSDNELTSLPKEIGYLPYLRRLLLSRNKLTSLPFEVWCQVGSGEQMLSGEHTIRGKRSTFSIPMSYFDLEIEDNPLEKIPGGIIPLNRGSGRGSDLLKKIQHILSSTDLSDLEEILVTEIEELDNEALKESKEESIHKLFIALLELTSVRLQKQHTLYVDIFEKFNELKYLLSSEEFSQLAENHRLFMIDLIKLNEKRIPSELNSFESKLKPYEKVLEGLKQLKDLLLNEAPLLLQQLQEQGIYSQDEVGVFISQVNELLNLLDQTTFSYQFTLKFFHERKTFFNL